VARTVTVDDVVAARDAVRDVARHTPVLPSETLSERAGATVLLKAEALQRTGSFKIRGALSKLAALGAHAADGVVAGSAGNHAQALAFAARVRGVPCEVHMPREAPISKVEGAAALGARIVQEEGSVDDCVAAAARRAEEAGMAFVHPFDDPDVVAGQGTLGLELLEDVEDLARVVVPVGGGGLVSGVAAAIKQSRPDVVVVGVEPSGAAKMSASLKAGHPVTLDSTQSIADGLMPVRPGDLTFAHVHKYVDAVVTVDDAQIARAALWLFHEAKQVVEPSGAATVAAVLWPAADSPLADTSAKVVAILSGGNVAPSTLATLTEL